MRLTEYVDGEISQDLEVTAPMTIGRGVESTYRIAIGNTACSRVQATIKKDGAGWILIDGDEQRPSRNGVWCDGKLIDRSVKLQPGMSCDVFRAGSSRATVEGISEGSELATAEIPLELSALHTSIRRLQDRAVAGDAKIEGICNDIKQLKLNGDRAFAFQGVVENRLDLLSAEISSAMASVVAANQAQDSQLRDHNTMIKRCCGVLAVLAMGGGVFNAAKTPDGSTQAINWILGISGVGGSAIALGVEERRRDV